MACFTNLSNQLYFKILQDLPPPDLGNLFCVNKHLYALTAGHRKRYQSLKRRFSTCLDTKQPGSTARLVKSILADPQIPLYVQHFMLNGCRPTSDTSHQILNYTASDTVVLELALRDLEYLSADEVQKWISDFRDAPEGTLISLALTLFSNLTSIHIHYSRDFEYRDGDDTFRRVSALLRDMIYHSTARKSNQGLFAKLISVTISGSDGSFSYYANLVEVFATLPSVKIINIDRIRDFEQSLQAITPARGSNVTDLNICNADLSPHRLIFLLQSFRRLHSFTYWPTNDPQPQYKFDPFLIVTALLACAKDSLRELHIRAGPATPTYMGTLRNFRVLEYLDTDTELLYGIMGPGLHNFSTSLPPSIHEIKLHGWHEDFNDLLGDLRKSRIDFPRLRNIEIFQNRFHQDDMAGLRDACAVINISLQLAHHAQGSLPVYDRHRGHYAERQAKKACESL